MGGGEGKGEVPRDFHFLVADTRHQKQRHTLSRHYDALPREKTVVSLSLPDLTTTTDDTSRAKRVF